MSDYGVVNNWAGLDLLVDTDPNKIISGSTFDTEFTTIRDALNSKQDELALKDDDTMSSPSSTAVASQQSIKAYVDAQIKTPGTVAQIATLQTRDQNTYTAPTSGDGVEIAELTITMTPKEAGNKVILEWHFNGEAQHDTVWIVTRDGTQLPETTDATDNRYAGITATSYDNNTTSTPDNVVIRIIDEDSLSTSSVYKLLCRSSTDNTRTVYVNRTQGSSGADAFESGLSSCVATEVWT
jgi:hypothetical protein